MNLAQEKREELKERAAKKFKILSVSVFVAFGILITALTWFGVSYIDALEGITGTIAVTFFMYTWIAYGKIGVNQFLDMLKSKVLQHIYMKNGFNPKVIDELQMSIVDKIAQLNMLNEHKQNLDLQLIEYGRYIEKSVFGK
ncbi:hypothetical protein GCM10011506_22060 [Marivirga lumbricoides]|nr:hypothetical protein GCM10011506_22060 [Marivirga lumbricoides]